MNTLIMDWNPKNIVVYFGQDRSDYIQNSIRVDNKGLSRYLEKSWRYSAIFNLDFSHLIDVMKTKSFIHGAFLNICELASVLLCVYLVFNRIFKS